MSSYTALADRLANLAVSIRKASGDLSGEAAAAAALKLEKAAAAFQKIVTGVLAASDPAAKELAHLLRSQSAAQALDAKGVALLAKGHLGTAFKPKKTETGEQARERLLQCAAESGLAEEILSSAKRWVEAASSPLPREDNEEALRDELRRLGSLAPAEQQIAVETRLQGALLTKLLRMTGFKPNAKGTVAKKKLEEFLSYCRKLHENTSWRAA